jgi:hypothetical protein
MLDDTEKLAEYLYEVSLAVYKVTVELQKLDDPAASGPLLPRLRAAESNLRTVILSLERVVR